jgi:hypothetical protein
MKVLVSLLLLIATMVAVLGARCMVDLTVYMAYFLQ